MLIGGGPVNAAVLPTSYSTLLCAAMSNLSAFFVASKSDAKSYMNQDFGAIKCDSIVEASGITDLEVSTLYALVKREEFDFDKHEFDPSDESDGSSLYRLPSRFVKALVGLQESEIDSICEYWANTEEMACEAEPLVPLVQSLRRIAALVEKGRDLYFCCSL